MKRREHVQYEDAERDLVDLLDDDLGDHYARNPSPNGDCEDYEELARSLARCPSMDESEEFAFGQEAAHVVERRREVRRARMERLRRAG